MLHLGLGNFFRAHQAWYTQHAPDAAHWGIAAFTGRRPDVADALRPQDGLYALITRGPDGDAVEVVGSVVDVHSASASEAWLRYMCSPQLAVITMTVTETAYRHDPHHPDVAALRHDPAALVRSVPARLLGGLIARDRAGTGPIAVVPCDNLPANGDRVSQVLRELAAQVGPEAERAVDRTATFVNTVVDRITPRADDADIRTARSATGLTDTAPVVTEPFTEWVIAGEFPAGRPRWEAAGAVFTDDVSPFAQRKLRLLNGGHSLLAYLGSIRGHRTVAQALEDPVCRAWLQRWWVEAAAQLTGPGLGLSGYQAALLGRFANPRIQHRLDQIAADGSQKLPVRILPVLQAENATGSHSSAATQVLAAWVCHLRGRGAPVNDPHARATDAGGPLTAAVPRLLRILDPNLGMDLDVVAQVVRQAEAIERENGEPAFEGSLS
ncbi:mannitol dehydrogenase family protein [Dactylosporangium sp. McL0621]|uniref:mannitol dehydrogenase family protein n=1 Tax=Dactylosporangium sp. McL0621 TaxID=3415678 RepID=UPI003CF2E56A